jgi:hypothetical protein
MRRRQLRRVVIAAVSVCALILVAAGIVRVVHASSEPEPTPRAASTTSTSTAGATPLAAAAVAPGLPAAAAAPDTTNATAPTTGTLRLERNVAPRSVWLDGRKLNTRSEVVTCGPHQLKVGRSKGRAIDVPCGGELRVAR